MSNPWDEFAALSADVQALLEWEQSLGSTVLPFENIPRTERAPVVPSCTRRPSTVRSPQRISAPVARRAEPAAPVAKSTPAPPENTPALPEKKSQTIKKTDTVSGASGNVGLSASWDAYMTGGAAYKIVGPLHAPLMIVRGAGSSENAETMLERMIENVIKLDRTQVAIVDLVRDSRSPEMIGEELRRDLVKLRPGLILVMGTFSAQALLGEQASMQIGRGEWQQFEWSGGAAAARLTHHPEALLAMAARGQHGAKRETFEDLQEVAKRLS